MSRADKLTDDERRAVILPGSDQLESFIVMMARTQRVAFATVDRGMLLRQTPPTRTTVLVDAVRGDCGDTAMRLTVVDAQHPSDGAADLDVIFGCGVNARLLRAALLALSGQTVEIRWHGRFEPLGLVSGGDTAIVMPLRCCGHGAQFGEYWIAGVRHTCPCRDCAAGRQWGWR